MENQEIHVGPKGVMVLSWNSHSIFSVPLFYLLCSLCITHMSCLLTCFATRAHVWLFPKRLVQWLIHRRHLKIVVDYKKEYTNTQIDLHNGNPCFFSSQTCFYPCVCTYIGKWQHPLTIYLNQKPGHPSAFYYTLQSIHQQIVTQLYYPLTSGFQTLKLSLV